MSDYLAERFLLDTIEMRAAYCDALIAAAEENPDIIDVESDVQYSMGTRKFKERFPDRTINCGIMEAHAVGFCGGLSSMGYIPFYHAFGTFATRRAFDQVFLSLAYQNMNVKIVGGDAGVTATANGGTHMPFEDMGLMRLVPGMTVIEPADSVMYKTAIRDMANTYGNYYIRSCRRKTIKIYREDAKFQIGKANVLTQGTDVAIIACGIMVYQALLAREILAEKGVSARVIDMHTIKPLDKGCVIKAAEECGAVVTAENHNIIGGLGEAVCAALSENHPVPSERVGVEDKFGQVGTQEYLMEIYGLTAKDIAQKALLAVSRKNKV
jgi:transketolase